MCFSSLTVTLIFTSLSCEPERLCQPCQKAESLREDIGRAQQGSRRQGERPAILQYRPEHSILLEGENRLSEELPRILFSCFCLSFLIDREVRYLNVWPWNQARFSKLCICPLFTTWHISKHFGCEKCHYLPRSEYHSFVGVMCAIE